VVDIMDVYKFYLNCLLVIDMFRKLEGMLLMTEKLSVFSVNVVGFNLNRTTRLKPSGRS